MSNSQHENRKFHCPENAGQPSLKVSLAAANNKIAQLDLAAARRVTATDLGMPIFRDVAQTITPDTANPTTPETA